MSKRELKKYLIELDKEELANQLVSLYDKFPAVKTYYDFVFNPKEVELIRACKLKIANEYFPVKGKRPKARRSIAQKFIKHFQILGVDSYCIADVMCFAIEIAQTFSSEKPVKQELFCKSMFSSLEQAIQFCIKQGIYADFKPRFIAIQLEATTQNWFNKNNFEEALTFIEY